MGHAFILDLPKYFQAIKQLAVVLGTHADKCATETELGHVKLSTGFRTNNDADRNPIPELQGVMSLQYGIDPDTVCEGNDFRLNNARRPISHSTTDKSYGTATAAAYGHVKLSDSVKSNAGAAQDGVLASAKSIYNLDRECNTLITTLKDNFENIGLKECYDICEKASEFYNFPVQEKSIAGIVSTYNILTEMGKTAGTAAGKEAAAGDAYKNGTTTGYNDGKNYALNHPQYTHLSKTGATVESAAYKNAYNSGYNAGSSTGFQYFRKVYTLEDVTYSATTEFKSGYNKNGWVDILAHTNATTNEGYFNITIPAGLYGVRDYFLRVNMFVDVPARTNSASYIKDSMDPDVPILSKGGSKVTTKDEKTERNMSFRRVRGTEGTSTHYFALSHVMMTNAAGSFSRFKSPINGEQSKLFYSDLRGHWFFGTKDPNSSVNYNEPGAGFVTWLDKSSGNVKVMSIGASDSSSGGKVKIFAFNPQGSDAGKGSPRTISFDVEIWYS